MRYVNQCFNGIEYVDEYQGKNQILGFCKMFNGIYNIYCKLGIVDRFGYIDNGSGCSGKCVGFSGD